MDDDPIALMDVVHQEHERKCRSCFMMRRLAPCTECAERMATHLTTCHSWVFGMIIRRYAWRRAFPDAGQNTYQPSPSA